MEEVQEKDGVQPVELSPVLKEKQDETPDILTPPPEPEIREKDTNEIVEKQEEPIIDKKDENHEDHVDNDENDENDEDDNEEDEDGSSVPEEREEGDGEEEKEAKKLDDDEDKKNPQYIPKKGMFYEHDDRTAEGEEETPEEKADDKKGKKGKVWEEVEKWKHDLYNDDEQSPKTTQELIDMYGYDIRNEEGPPKARRRRRYGKGPNKYQRSWEDENAYMKGSSNARGRPRGGGGGYRGNFVKKEEDFPELPKSAPAKMDKSTNNQQGNKYKENDENKKIFKKVQISDKVTIVTEEHKPVDFHPNPKPFGRGSFRGSGRGRGRGMARQRPGSGRTPSTVAPTVQEPREPQEPLEEDTSKEDIAMLAQHFSQAVINVNNDIIIGKPGVVQNENHEKVKNQGVKSAKTAPAQQQESRSKRYSAQRQRPLPQANQPNQPYIQPPQQQPPNYYTPPQVENPPGPNYPGVQVVAFLPPPPLPPPQQPQYPPPPIYVPQPQFIPPPAIAVQPGPAEVYQGGGITYYSTQSQLANPPQLPKRVKIAIPIVSPNESPET